jgi:hypothetical protein
LLLRLSNRTSAVFAEGADLAPQGFAAFLEPCEKRVPYLLHIVYSLSPKDLNPVQKNISIAKVLGGDPNGNTQ